MPINLLEVTNYEQKKCNTDHVGVLYQDDTVTNYRVERSEEIHQKISEISKVQKKNGVSVNDDLNIVQDVPLQFVDPEVDVVDDAIDEDGAQQYENQAVS